MRGNSTKNFILPYVFVNLDDIKKGERIFSDIIKKPKDIGPPDKRKERYSNAL